MLESLIKKQLLEIQGQSTPPKVGVLCEINSWAETLLKDHSKPALRIRKHRKMTSQHGPISAREQNLQIRYTPTLLNLRKERDDLMRNQFCQEMVAIIPSYKNSQQNTKLDSGQENTKPGSGHQSLEQIKDSQWLKKRACIRVNQFRVEGEKRKASIEHNLSEKNNLHNCPRPYRRMSIQYRKKTKQMSHKSITSNQNKDLLSFTALKQRFQKNSNHCKWVAEMNKKAKQICIKVSK